MASETVDGYDDIHDNMRFWSAQLATVLDGPVLLDVGSNDGELSLPLLERGLVARVVAVEPLAAARARLMSRVFASGRQAALWGTAPVTLIPLALGAEDRMIEIGTYSDDTFSSLYPRPTEEMERYGLALTERSEVRMRPLDDLLAAGLVPAPGMVKIDVEGAERDVLRGAHAALSAGYPPVMIEYSCPNTANAGYERSEIAAELEHIGYDTLHGLYRNRERALFTGPAALADCRIWNLIATRSGVSPLVDQLIAQYLTAWKDTP